MKSINIFADFFSLSKFCALSFLIEGDLRIKIKYPYDLSQAKAFYLN